MCRWLAYSGPPIYVEKLVADPEHSLIDQSLFAERNYVPSLHQTLPTNGDGFGLGWYDERGVPGQFREVRLAYNDVNLWNLAQHIKSPMFLAHVRATGGHNVQRTNNHPFRYKQWLFQHNGEINRFELVRKQLVCEVGDTWFDNMKGNVDSELCFHLALTYGLEDDPVGALQRMVGRVERARRDFRIDEPFVLSCCAADGKSLYAVRYSSDRQSKTLFHASDVRNLKEKHGVERLPPGNVIVCSEPLDRVEEDWKEVDESTLVVVAEQHVETRPFEPIAP